MIERYTPPQGIGLTVLLPCSARKPYSKSKSHMSFRYHIRRGARGKYPLVHEVTLTSPLGIVPRELEEVYPAAHYDVPVTGVWSQEEIGIARSLIKDYMDKSNAPVIAHVEEAYKEICEGFNVESTSGDLGRLETLVAEKLEDKKPDSPVPERIRRVRAVCDFQFGGGAWEHLSRGGIVTKGFQIQDKEGELIATIDRCSGYLALSLKGAELLQSNGRYLVELSFKPETANVFCAGIEKADRVIRPRDEVIATYNGEVVGVGKAALSGIEMERAEKGLGLTLRHRKVKS